MKTIVRYLSFLLLLVGVACNSTGQAPASVDKFSTERLITEAEINSISEDIGVEQWKLVDEFSGENALRNTFQGSSWSANPNEALNSIIKIHPGSTFQDVIASMLESGMLFAGAIPVNSSLTFEDEFAVYASSAPNGQASYDLLVSKDGLLYWASVTLGTSVGETPESMYNNNRDVVDAFLNAMLTINFE